MNKLMALVCRLSWLLDFFRGICQLLRRESRSGSVLRGPEADDHRRWKPVWACCRRSSCSCTSETTCNDYLPDTVKLIIQASWLTRTSDLKPPHLVIQSSMGGPTCTETCHIKMQFVWLQIHCTVKYIYTVSQKNIPDISDCNLKTNYQILIIFGTNIPDTTCH